MIRSLLYCAYATEIQDHNFEELFTITEFLNTFDQPTCQQWFHHGSHRLCMNWRVCAVVATLLLSGCSGFVTGPESTDTVTPAPVPSESRGDPAGDRLPPGIIENRIVDTNALVNAHQQQLHNRSHQMRVRVTSDGNRGQRLVRIESPTRYYWRDNASDSTWSVTAFADGTHLYIRTNRSGSLSYNRGNVTGAPSTPTTRLMKPFLQVGHVTVSKIRVDTQVNYEIAGTYDVHPNIENFRNYSVRAIVTPSGLIRTLDVEYTTAASDGEPTTIAYHYRYTAVGSTIVSRPAWVDNRWNQTIEQSAVARKGG